MIPITSTVLVVEPDRRQPVAMAFADKPAIDLPRADADATVHRQVAVKLRHGHRDAPASVVGDYRIGESGIEHSGFPSGCPVRSRDS
jgi:hypothetical protein